MAAAINNIERASMRAICRTDTAPKENQVLSCNSNGDKQHAETTCCSQSLLRVSLSVTTGVPDVDGRPLSDHPTL